MKILVTGAGGFVGGAVTRALSRRSDVHRVLLLDSVPPKLPQDARFDCVGTDLTRADLGPILEGVDTIIHLASVPGGSAESEPRLSRRVNLDVTLAILEELDSSGKKTRFIYASSIAVLGEHSEPVDDVTSPRPSLVYGAHKLMVEIAMSDFHRRDRVSTLALRLPGIVARPRAPSGLRSAFMSEIFHAAAAGEPYTMPVSPEATLWLMSAQCAARNLVHAALLPHVDGRAVTLPALRVTSRQLALALYGEAPPVRYEPDRGLEAKFGAFPPLRTPAAEAMGFQHDGSLDALIAATRSIE